MEKKIKIFGYSVYNNYKATSDTDNVSDVIDRMIRVVAKVTELYASDIVYSINNLQDAIKNKTSMCLLLGFRDGGVNSFPLRLAEKGEDLGKYMLASYPDGSMPDPTSLNSQNYIQFWALETHPEKRDTYGDSEVIKTTFERVNLVPAYEYCGHVGEAD